MSKLSLMDFLTQNAVDNIVQKVVLSERLKEYPFTIRAMTESEYSELSKACVKVTKRGDREFDAARFRLTSIINHTIEPNFKDADALKRAGCTTPEQFVRKSLLAGEASELARRISKLSGFDEDMDDLVEEAKNS